MTETETVSAVLSDMETVGYVNSVTFEDGAVTNIQNGPGYITSGHWEDL